MAIAFVNGTTVAATSGTSFNLAAFTVSAGNLIVIIVRYSNTSRIVTGITDTAGNTYTNSSMPFVENIANIKTAEMWYAKNISGNASNQITVSCSTTANDVWASAGQWSGCDTTSPLDTTASGSTASGTSATTGAFTTSQADEVLILGGTTDTTGRTFSATSYTQRVVDTDKVSTLLDQVVSATQTGATATLNISGGAQGIIALLATFKQAGGGASARPILIGGRIVGGGLTQRGLVN